MTHEGFLYAVLNQDGSLKLGLTRRPERLSWRYGKKNQVLGIIPASREVESWFHRRFMADKLPGAIELYAAGSPAANLIMSLPFRPTMEDWPQEAPGFDFSTIGFLPKSAKPKNPYAVMLGRLGGRKSPQNFARMDPERLRAHQVAVATARWSSLRGKA